MINKFNVPEEHRTGFRRLMRILPDSFREDEKKIQTLLIYLKIGGEKLARQRLEIAKKAFQREFALFKRVRREKPADDAEDGDDGEKDDSGDEAGEDENDSPVDADENLDSDEDDENDD